MIDWDAAVVGPSMSVFGEPVQYLPATTAPFPIVGVYDDAYVEVDPASGMGISSASPVLGVQLSQFSFPPAQGDRLVVQRTGEMFIVKKVRPDSHGAAKLMLNSDT